MELSAIESPDQIIEHPKTEVALLTLYGSMTRTLNDTRSETLRFTYCDFGLRTKNVSWPYRKDLIKKFLVGTHPLDYSMYQVITIYKELETANALTTGPIDLQFATYLKNIGGNSKEGKALSRRIKKRNVSLTPAAVKKSF
jgi:hypothetical protein